MAPILLPPNYPPRRFYSGGAMIGAFRQLNTPVNSYEPEDWVASTTCCRGQGTIGMTRLSDGTLLADAVTSEPEKWLGPDHVAKYGPDTKLLVKLLDPGQRLPVHAHPHVDWASKHLQRKHGKAEAWYILMPGSVWLGLTEDIDPKELLQIVQEERGAELLDRMHKIDVEPHQTVYVPPGVLHAINYSTLMVEVQEPEDLSILCEWTGYKIDGKKDGHLGLGFEAALTAVETRGRTREEIMALVTDSKASESVFVEESQSYFHLERVHINGQSRCRRGFAILVVLMGGNVRLTTESGSELSILKKGTTVVIPYEDGEFILEAENGDVVIARPPQ